MNITIPHSIGLVAILLAAAAMPAMAIAQAGDDVVVMRRPLASPQKGFGAVTPTPTPLPTPTPAPMPTPAPAAWSADDWTYVDANSCTDTARQTRTVACLAGGAAVDESRCAGPRPEAERTQERTEGCAFSWKEEAWGAWSTTCGTGATRTRAVRCERSDGLAAADALCAGAKPDSRESADHFEGCTTTWAEAPWSDFAPTCSATATRSRIVACHRSDGSDVDDAQCADPKPGTTETAGFYAGCSYSWATDAFIDPGASCTTGETQTRQVSCKRDIDGTMQADAACEANLRPSATRTVSDYRACTASRTWTMTSNQIGHLAGYQVGSGWGADPSVPSNYIIYGPYDRGAAPGTRTAQWRIRIDNNTADDAVVATLDVFESTGGGGLLAGRTLRRSDFAAANVAQTFELPFTWQEAWAGGANSTLELRVQYHGTGRIVVESVGYR